MAPPLCIGQQSKSRNPAVNFVDNTIFRLVFPGCRKAACAHEPGKNQVDMLIIP
jgi:hypothetical protein